MIGQLIAGGAFFGIVRLLEWPGQPRLNVRLAVAFVAVPSLAAWLFDVAGFYARLPSHLLVAAVLPLYFFIPLALCRAAGHPWSRGLAYSAIFALAVFAVAN